MRLFPKKEVVCQILDDSGDYHKASANGTSILILGNFDVNYFRLDDRRRDEPSNANEMVVTRRTFG